MSSRPGSHPARRVVVTGIGLVSPVRIGAENTWQALLKGESGIAPISLFDPAGFACRFAGEVKGFRAEDYISRKDIKKMGRFIQFAMAAAEFALLEAALQITPDNAERVGVFVGSGIGAFEVIEREHAKLLTGGPGRVSPFFINATIANLASGQISIRYGAKGPNVTCATACTTGAHGIGEAWHVIRRGDADVMICGGSEAAVTPLLVAGFASMRALSTANDDPSTASRPWDKTRDSFVVGEGAGVLILEEREHALQRGAKILAELVGYATNSDAFHTKAPPENGSGVRRVMELAMASANVSPLQIGYLNAHATSTPLGDRAEAQAIRDAFGDAVSSLQVSSTKSMTGHLLGGAGSLEAGITVLALRDQVAPPTTNTENLDDDINLNIVLGQPVAMAIEHAMTNSFGFGGTNASLIFESIPLLKQSPVSSRLARSRPPPILYYLKTQFSDSIMGDPSFTSASIILHRKTDCCRSKQMIACGQKLMELVGIRRSEADNLRAAQQVCKYLVREVIEVGTMAACRRH